MNLSVTEVHAAGECLRQPAFPMASNPVMTRPMPRERLLRIGTDGISLSIAIAGCGEVAKGLAGILRGWDIREETREPSERAIVRLRRTQDGYRRVSPWVKTPSESREAFRTHHSDALFGVHYDLLSWYLQAQRSRPCLHSAAVCFRCGLVVFPNTTRAGKTTLTIQLAIQGHQIFGDDWLPIQDNVGVALGILPWLRLPAPVDVREDFKRFMKSRRGPANRRWLYVNLRDDELAIHGATAPVRGLVLLERRAGGGAHLVPIAKDKMLSELIAQNYARQLPATDIFDQLYALTQAANCYSLEYSSVREAAALLQDVFGRPT
jgi:hypothetical protein